MCKSFSNHCTRDSDAARRRPFLLYKNKHSCHRMEPSLPQPHHICLQMELNSINKGLKRRIRSLSSLWRCNHQATYLRIIVSPPSEMDSSFCSNYYVRKMTIILSPNQVDQTKEHLYRKTDHFYWKWLQYIHQSPQGKMGRKNECFNEREELIQLFPPGNRFWTLCSKWGKK